MMGDAERILIVSGQHFAAQPRKVDLHFMADALKAEGVAVDFLSLRLSLISRLMGDGRWAYAANRICNCWVSVDRLGDEFIWVNFIHPMAVKSSLGNQLSGIAVRHYGRLLPKAVKRRLPDYSHILVESGISALLLHALRLGAPAAKIIYHAADRLATIGTHPAAASHLSKYAKDIDLGHIMAEAIRPDIPPGVPVIHLSHGISKEAFLQASSNPYVGLKNAVSVGDMLFDADVIEMLAQSFPDWTFHLFGRLARLGHNLPNVKTHGEVPFEDIVAFIKYADMGIAPYKVGMGADYLSQSSLKMIQYTFCQLPIVAPIFAAAGRAHVFGYQTGSPDSLRNAFESAQSCRRSTIDISAVMSWNEKTARLLEAANRSAVRLPSDPNVKKSRSYRF